MGPRWRRDAAKFEFPAAARRLVALLPIPTCEALKFLLGEQQNFGEHKMDQRHEVAGDHDLLGKIVDRLMISVRKDPARA